MISVDSGLRRTFLLRVGTTANLHDRRRRVRLSPCASNRYDTGVAVDAPDHAPRSRYEPNAEHRPPRRAASNGAGTFDDGLGQAPPVPEITQFLQGPQKRSFELGRAVGIFFEIMRGFRKLHFVGPCVTVFGSARFTAEHQYYVLAREVGQRLARAGFTVMTGGGPGIMEAANRGAKKSAATPSAATSSCRRNRNPTPTSIVG